MFGTLPESRPARRRSPATTAISVTFHAIVIGLVAYATGQSAPRRTDADLVRHTTTMIYRPPPVSTDIVHHGTRGGAFSESPLPLPIPRHPTIDVALSLPSESPSLPADPGSSITWDRPGSATGSPGVPSGTPADGPIASERADRAAIPLRGNPEPRYPSMLRESGKEGQVLLRFVIDSTGRVDVRSVRVVSSDDERFTVAVRDVLPRMRFAPAQLRGRDVAVLVQQPFVFQLRR